MASRRQVALQDRVSGLAERGIVPTIAPILVGDNSASRLYYNAKKRLAERLGIGFAGVELPEETRQEDLLNVIDALNADPQVDGIFVELPLPAHISLEAVTRAIDPEKDIDCINPVSMGRMLVESAHAKDYRELSNQPDILLPATPQAVMELLLESGVDLVGKEAVVIGRSLSVGRPLSLLLLTAGATVTVCHSMTVSIEDIARRADVLCVSIGKPRYITLRMVKREAVVIDVGINVTQEGIVGDVDYEGVAPRARLITPVPGGVGPMTTTMIMENVVKCASNRT